MATTPEDWVYDLATPRRPTIDDADPTMVNETPLPLAGQPHANQLNLYGRMVAAAGRMLGVAVIEVDFAAGVPFVVSIVAMSEEIVTGDITVADNGNGDTSLTWAANTFPPAVQSPDASIVVDGSWLAPVALAITNGVQVKTRNSAGTLTDARFKVYVQGQGG